MILITTSTGTTIHTAPSEHGTMIILDHPAAPDDMRCIEAGRIVEGGGFQPAPFAVWAASPETLRAIADLIDAQSQPDSCDPAAGYHSMPHRGCILR